MIIIFIYWTKNFLLLTAAAKSLELKNVIGDLELIPFRQTFDRFGHKIILFNDPVFKIYNFPAAKTDEMVMMARTFMLVRKLKRRTALAEITAFDHIHFDEEIQIAVDRREADVRVGFVHAKINRFSAQMMLRRFLKNAENHLTRLGNAVALFTEPLFPTVNRITGMRHTGPYW